MGRIYVDDVCKREIIYLRNEEWYSMEDWKGRRS